MQVNVSYYKYTNRGGRDINEDSLACASANGYSYFILADGLGGHDSGEVASRFVVNELAKCFKKIKITGINQINNVFELVNHKLVKLKESNGFFTNMKTTAAALYIKEGKAYVAYAGDTRVYFFRGGEMAEHTADHTVTYKKFLAGDISYNDINTDDDRTRLLAAFGNRGKLSAGNFKNVITLKTGDAFLLCTDGFWEYMDAEEMNADRVKSRSPRQWAEYMLLRHIRRTKILNDNFSLITVLID